MAEIVIGIGTSHSPQLSIRAKDWEYLLKKDETDPRLDYPGLAAKRPNRASINELTPEKFRERDQACQTAIRTLGEALQAARADLVVIFGDDQQEQFHDDNMPTFAIYHGKSVPVVKDNKHQSVGVERRGAARLGRNRGGVRHRAGASQSSDSLARRCRVRHRALQQAARRNRRRPCLQLSLPAHLAGRQAAHGAGDGQHLLSPQSADAEALLRFRPGGAQRDRIVGQRQASGAHGFGRAEPRGDR